MNRRRLFGGLAGGLALLGLATVVIGATSPRWLRALLLEDSPLQGVNQASAQTPEEIEAVLVDARADRRLALTGPALARLGGPPGVEAPVYEIEIADGTLRCRSSLAVEGRWLNIDSQVQFEIHAGEVTQARARALRVGRLDFGSWLSGWDAAPWVRSRLEAASETDPSVRTRLATLEQVRIVDDHLEVSLGEGWEELLARP